MNGSMNNGSATNDPNTAGSVNSAGPVNGTDAVYTTDNPMTKRENAFSLSGEARQSAAAAEEDRFDTAAKAGETAERYREPQSDEENSRYAAARRKAERQRDEAIAADRAEIRAAIADLDLRDPVSGETVTDPEGLKRWTRQFKAEREKAERLRAESEREEAKSAGERYIADQIEKIRAVDPKIRDFADLQRGEKREQMEAMIRRGYDVADAYILANRDSLFEAKARAARQEALTSVAGRGHLDRSDVKGAPAPEIPSEQMRAFRRMLPRASLAEIRRFYARDQRDTKKD